MMNPRFRSVFIRVMRRWVLIFLGFEVLAFSLLGTNFFSLDTLQNILVSSTIVLLLAVGETFVIITGGIDLSVGFMVGFTGVVCAKIMVTLQAAGTTQAMAIAAGIAAALLVGLLPGFINGFLVAHLKVPPFIATFGMYGIAYGCAEIICNNVPIHDLPSAVGPIGHGFLFFWLPGKMFRVFVEPTGLSSVDFQHLITIIPNLSALALVFVLVFGFILAKTRFGRHTYAIGGNIDAAERAGIDVKRHLVKVYMISSFFASLAGVCYVLRYITGRAPAGSAQVLDAVVAVVIGGASLYGGKGSVSGTFVGAMVLTTLVLGLANLALPTYYAYIAVGCILIFAVLIDQFSPELVHKED
ncbi:MAG: ABC transporter permease [Candidatus Bipolaricaulota bacterium]|jgi:ribose transport system permease protein|nr:ABC transporter permease [Candidatus Bipolaricaulota bacterium]